MAGDFPPGFARRFLEYARTAGPAWANIDLELGEIDYLDDDPEFSARLHVDDRGLIPTWPSLGREARAFYPRLSDEEGAMVMLTVSIEEFLRTNYSAQPRYFAIEQVPG
ncbi:MAG TPA: hypothetical protein VHZ81_08330 [Galbitalea sp.]|jgi:hypothetical protein|nr:hypothetical protein [Galbitalea sp.]